LYREFAAARERRKDEMDRDITVAWHTVRIYFEAKSKKRLPSLTSQLTRQTGDGKQSRGQLKSMLGVLSEQYGIPLRRAGKAVAV